MGRSESVGFASIIVAVIILAVLLAFLFVPGFAIYLPGTLIGIGSIVAVIFLGIGLLGKQ